MTRVKSIEFWLFALPALFILSACLWRFNGIAFVSHLFPILGVAWVVLAIAWMLREVVRRIRG